LESSPVVMWQERALAYGPVTQSLSPASSRGEADRRAGEGAVQCAALLALARVGDREIQPRVRGRLVWFVSQRLTNEQRLMALRALAVSYIRHGSPERTDAARAISVLEKTYPAADSRVNQQLCELLVFLEAPSMVRRTMPLLAAAPTQ